MNKTKETIIRDVDKLNVKNYAIYDRTFMAFGSACNGLQGKLNTLGDIIELWKWSQVATKEFVEELYKNNGQEEEVEI